MTDHHHHHQLQLHQLLKEDQEPFHLKSYIANKRSKFKTPPSTTNLHLNNQSSSSSLNRTALCKHACFLSFNKSPLKSPLIDFQSPSPCKSRNDAVFLKIPSTTAAVLAEAAIRIQNKENLKSKGLGFGLIGSILQRFKNSKKRAIENDEIRVLRKREIKVKYDSIRMNGEDLTEICDEKLVDLDCASTSSCCSEGDFDSRQSFCVSPFRFSLCKSSSSDGCRTPEFCSPVVSPVCHNQEKDNLESRDSENVQAEGEEKEQCSPVSVLDPPFEDSGHESGVDCEDEDYDHECSYANVQRAKQQLLQRLRRFEKLAELDPMELERKLLDGSDSEDQGEREESDNDEPSSLYGNQSLNTSLTKPFNRSTIHSRSSNDIISLGRIYNKVDFHTIDTMIELDFKTDFDGWRKFPEQREDTVADIELALFEFLIEELSDELFCQEFDCIHLGCS